MNCSTGAEEDCDLSCFESINISSPSLIKRQQWLAIILVEGCMSACNDNPKYDWRENCLSSEMRGWRGKAEVVCLPSSTLHDPGSYW